MVTSTIRSEKRRYYDNEFVHANDPKKMWTKINMVLGKTKESPPKDFSANEFNG